MTCSSPRLRTLESPPRIVTGYAAPRIRTLEASPRFVICHTPIVAGGATTYDLAFDDGDLVTGMLSVTHALGANAPAVAVYDAADPANRVDAPVTVTSTNAVDVDLIAITVAPTWHVGVAYEYELAFTSAALAAGVLSVPHSLATLAPIVVLYDDGGNQVFAPITRVDADTVEIDLSGYTVTGTWYAGVVSGFADTFVDSDITAGILTVSHAQGRLAPCVVIYDNGDPANRYTMPSTVVDANTVTCDLSSLGTLTGTWHVGVV